MRLRSLHFAMRTGRLAALAVLAASLTGCQVIGTTPQYTQVRIIDVSPDAPGLDVYQDSTVNLYNIGYGTASSYIAIAPATYSYSADVAGSRQHLGKVNASFSVGAQYTVLIGNVTARMQMSVLQDQSTPATVGQVALRFLDQSTRNGPVDIYLLPPGSALSGVSPIASNVSFGNIPTYLSAPSGTYSIVVVPAGTVPGEATSPLYTGKQVDYASTSARTILLIDQPLVTTEGLQVIIADDYDSPTATS